MMLTVCYGCGLRVNELVHLQVRDIDGERRLLRMDHGVSPRPFVQWPNAARRTTGQEVRAGTPRNDSVAPSVEIPPTLLVQLRQYWQVFRPYQWLFPGRDPSTAISITSAQKSDTAAKGKARADKLDGIHSLRHAYATHQLAAGMPITKLQHQLGHRDVRTTMRYLHWVPNYAGGEAGTDLIAELEVTHGR